MTIIDCSQCGSGFAPSRFQLMRLRNGASTFCCGRECSLAMLRARGALAKKWSSSKEKYHATKHLYVERRCRYRAANREKLQVAVDTWLAKNRAHWLEKLASYRRANSAQVRARKQRCYQAKKATYDERMRLSYYKKTLGHPDLMAAKEIIYQTNRLLKGG